MGEIIDKYKLEDNYRCKDVKIPIIFINLIGATVSLLLLLFGSFRMILAKKKLSFLTILILLIFSSEIINTISKLLQLLKYYFGDKRNDKKFDSGNTPRGVICQIQIVMAIYSDFCSLLGTLLLSLRCYDVIKNKKRFFDKGKNGIISIILTIIISILFSNGFLFVDKIVTNKEIAYRYDVRDRCSYWCWLEHRTSLGCFGIYWVLLLLNILFALKTYFYLKKGYKKLLEENDISFDKIKSNSSSMSKPLNEVDKEDNTPKDSFDEKKFSNLTKEERKRIEELRLMKIKCLTYPLVTIFIWIFAGIYRIVDDLVMMEYDNSGIPEDNSKKEKHDFEKNLFKLICVEFFLVLHTFISATRGIFYGLSFIVFEEKIFFNFFRRCFKTKLFDDEIEDNNGKKGILRNTNNSSTITDNNKEENEKEEEKNNVIEMNDSDYHDNE